MKYLRAVLFFFATLVIYLGFPLLGWGVDDLSGFFALSPRAGYAMLIAIFGLAVAYQAIDAPEGIRGGRGEDENQLTRSLIDSVQCLALYRAMNALGHTAAETGQILYEAILARRHELPPPSSPASALTPEQLMERRRQRAERSQERRYAADYVYAFVAGDREEFDYGYDFSECAAQNFYQM